MDGEREGEMAGFMEERGGQRRREQSDESQLKKLNQAERRQLLTQSFHKIYITNES